MVLVRKSLGIQDGRSLESSLAGIQLLSVLHC
jgi:hypothetical protein